MRSIAFLPAAAWAAACSVRCCRPSRLRVLRGRPGPEKRIPPHLPAFIGASFRSRLVLTPSPALGLARSESWCLPRGSRQVNQGSSSLCEANQRRSSCANISLGAQTHWRRIAWPRTSCPVIPSKDGACSATESSSSTMLVRCSRTVGYSILVPAARCQRACPSRLCDLGMTQHPDRPKGPGSAPTNHKTESSAPVPPPAADRCPGPSRYPRRPTPGPGAPSALAPCVASCERCVTRVASLRINAVGGGHAR